MNMQIERYKIDIFRDEDGDPFPPVIYAYMENDEGARVWEKGSVPHPYVLVAVDGGEWNMDLSPWEAGRVFRKGEDFGGGADAYLRDLTEKIIPSVEEELGYVPSERITGGYSLAGLFALYSVFKTDRFTACAAASASLWFDRFAQYCMEHRPDPVLKAVFLSLGDREHHTRNERMAGVASCTQQIYERLLILGLKAAFELNPGGHMDDPEGRTARAFSSVISML